jgi:hypothetical protein
MEGINKGTKAVCKDFQQAYIKCRAYEHVQLWYHSLCDVHCVVLKYRDNFTFTS